MTPNKKLCSLLQAYFDGQLGQDDMNRIAEHCRTCEKCRHNLQSLNTLSGYLKSCHASTPDKKTMDLVWKQVEERLVREQLSLREIVDNFWQWFFPRLRFLLRPALAAAFILFLIMVPILERNINQEAFAVETDIKKIKTKAHIMILHTKQRKWTVIWVMPMRQEEEEKDEK